MARGGQLFAPAPQPVNWVRILMYVIGGGFVCYILYLAFFKSCPSGLKKEKFDCPCKSNQGSGNWFKL